MTESQTVLKAQHRPPHTQANNVSVQLCSSLTQLDNGLDVGAIGAWLSREDPQLTVELITDLCNRDPVAAAPEGTYDESRLVLGLCKEETSTAAGDARLRVAGFDPFGVERVNLGGTSGPSPTSASPTEKGKLLLSAAVARARAYKGSEPSQFRVRLAGGGGRDGGSAMLTLPPIDYQPVISVRHDDCASEFGCRLCAAVCPTTALVGDEARLRLKADHCVACGVCLTACPTEALELPSLEVQQLKAELASLLAESRGTFSQRVVAFACAKTKQALEELSAIESSDSTVLLPVEVPCAGMVPTSWLLGSLAAGADSACVVSCSGCPYLQDEAISGRIDYCKELLAATGESPDRVALATVDEVAELSGTIARALETTTAPNSSGPDVSLDRDLLTTAAAVSSFTGPEPLTITHSSSPLGLVEIDPATCTACERCATACPTDALALGPSDDSVSITFDAGLCTGCAVCLEQCPEASNGAINVETTTDSSAIAQGRIELLNDPTVRCELCGSEIAPRSMLRSLEAMLRADGKTSDALISSMNERCLDCRAKGPQTTGLT